MGICDNSGKFKNDNNNKESSPINEREKKNKNNNVNIYSVQNNNGNVIILFSVCTEGINAVCNKANLFCSRFIKISFYGIQHTVFTKIF